MGDGVSSNSCLLGEETAGSQDLVGATSSSMPSPSSYSLTGLVLSEAFCKEKNILHLYFVVHEYDKTCLSIQAYLKELSFCYLLFLFGHEALLNARNAQSYQFQAKVLAVCLIVLLMDKVLGWRVPHGWRSARSIHCARQNVMPWFTSMSVNTMHYR